MPILHRPDGLAAFPLHTVSLAQGQVAYRASGQASQVTHVLLHGIGSASGSWVAQLRAAQTSHEHRLVAWEAPGYGSSTPLPDKIPPANAYASRMWQWLDALHVTTPVVLVGHSLGALVAAAAMCQQAQRVAGLTLLAPAHGYGEAPAAERDKKLQDRLALLEKLGPQGMAEQRSAAMLSLAAPAHLLTMVKATMAQIKPAGYIQAAHMLAGGRLLHDLSQKPAGLPIQVASGASDTITPPVNCQAVAAQAQVSWQDLGAVGHACPLEAATAVNALLGLPPVTI